MTYWNLDNLNKILDPTVHVDWRWRRVVELLEARERPTILDDDVIRETWKFGWKMAETEDAVNRAFIAKGYPSVYAAVTMRNHLGRSCNWLQALTLCEDLEIEEAADYMGMKLDALRMYELLFFDIRGGRDKKGYVSYMITTPDELQTITDGKDSKLVWKLIAMYGGFEAVKILWGLGTGSAFVSQYFRAAGDIKNDANYALSQFVQPIKSFSIEGICTTNMKLREIEDRRNQVRGAMNNRGNDFTDEIVGMMLNEIECSVLNPMEQAVKNREARYHEKMVEIGATGSVEAERVGQ